MFWVKRTVRWRATDVKHDNRHWVSVSAQSEMSRVINVNCQSRLEERIQFVFCSARFCKYTASFQQDKVDYFEYFCLDVFILLDEMR